MAYCEISQPVDPETYLKPSATGHRRPTASAVSRVARLIAALQEAPYCTVINPCKQSGKTSIKDQDLLDVLPALRWAEC